MYGDYDGDSEINEGGHLKTVKVIIVTNVCVFILISGTRTNAQRKDREQR
jgi:hypothetical protein